MPPVGPIKRKDLIYCLRQLGFEGPYSGKRHQYMRRRTVAVRLPNPHEGDIGTAFLLRILKRAEILRSEWEEL